MNNEKSIKVLKLTKLFSHYQVQDNWESRDPQD